MAAVAPEERIAQLLSDPAVEAGPGLKAADIAKRLKSAYGLTVNTSAVNSALYHGPFESAAAPGGPPLWRLKRGGGRAPRPTLACPELGFALWLEPGRVAPEAYGRVLEAVAAALAASGAAGGVECDEGTAVGRAAAAAIGGEKGAAAATDAEP